MVRVLVVGVPRSGTTWISRALGLATATAYVHEPDGPSDPFALRAKRGHALHNEIQPGTTAPEYRRLWAAAFAGGQFGNSPRSRLAKRWVDHTPIAERLAFLRGDAAPRRLRAAVAFAQPRATPQTPPPNVVVKSVHACLAAEWIAAEFSPEVVVVRRSPLNVLASWKTLGHGGDPRLVDQLAAHARQRWDMPAPALDDRAARQAFSYGVLLGSLLDSARRHPAWHIVRHDDVCIEPSTSLKALADTTGLRFSEKSESYVRQSNAPGDGYETKRVASTVVDKWHTILTEEEAGRMLSVLDAFPAELELRS